jgi:hypothetical protein
LHDAVGGMKHSGLGRESGIDAVREYLRNQERVDFDRKGRSGQSVRDARETQRVLG